jgi:hypothetical protein
MHRPRKKNRSGHEERASQSWHSAILAESLSPQLSSAQVLCLSKHFVVFILKEQKEFFLGSQSNEPRTSYKVGVPYYLFHFIKRLSLVHHF